MPSSFGGDTRPNHEFISHGAVVRVAVPQPLCRSLLNNGSRPENISEPMRLAGKSASGAHSDEMRKATDPKALAALVGFTGAPIGTLKTWRSCR
ncbi:hypothetical protein [Bradyrhizobium sp. BR 1432]|uniref:hypothetical protein n=1 Tax=Bradyrhizobium sp. BR 1432 TaxID=3447966 RepID=UPI003EE4B0AB